jgi:cell division protein FtsL
VVFTLGRRSRSAETGDVEIHEEATMHTTVDEQRARNRTADRRADLTEDVLYLSVLFAAIVVIAAIIVAAFVV